MQFHDLDVCVMKGKTLCWVQRLALCPLDDIQVFFSDEEGLLYPLKSQLVIA